jgi:type 1 glutamine amidotransferase
MWLVALVLGACGDNGNEPVPPPAEAGVTPADAREGALYVTPGQPGKPRVLVYTFENYWRHYSNIDAAIAIGGMNATRGFTILSTNDPLAINAKHLAQADVVVFAVTSGNGLGDQSQADLEAFVRAGGGIVGFHSASMTEWAWPFYMDNIGTQFAGHVPGLFPATVTNLSTTHPITAGLPDLQLTDEWYFFTRRPETVPQMQMLLALDESTLPADYPASFKQGYHPIAWAHEKYGGRVFYTAAGHNPATWQDPTFLEMTGRAIEWAAHQR